MRRAELFLPGVVAVLVGIAQAYLLVFCWTGLAMHGPLQPALATLGLSGDALRLSVLGLEFLLGALVSLPAALVVCRLRPVRLGLYLPLAVMPTFLWLLADLLARPTQDAVFVTGWLAELLALPAAAWLVRTLRPPHARHGPDRAAALRS